MEICGIICEYNPFHNGHAYQIQKAKECSNADMILCVMSGNFVQRGEAAVLEKHKRAKHALMAGADVVVELPTAFATSNAELFASGAIKLLSSIPAVKTLCFGAENADTDALINAAKLLNDEPREISETIQHLSSQGISYAKARAEAWSKILEKDLLVSPNNILGVEYTKAILKQNANIKILPIQRVGGGYLDTCFHEEYSSASAIRLGIKNNVSLVGRLPDYVSQDLPDRLENSLEILEKYALLSTNTTKIKEVCDCTEGLENALKRVAKTDAPLIESLTSARYTASRLRRITLQNLLKITEKQIRECLSTDLYLRILGIKKEKSDEILSILSQSSFPLLLRAHDENTLNDVAKKCLNSDRFAENIYRLLYPNSENTKTVFL